MPCLAGRVAGDSRAPLPPSGSAAEQLVLALDAASFGCEAYRLPSRSGRVCTGQCGPLCLRLLSLGGARAVSVPPYFYLGPRQASVPRLCLSRGQSSVTHPNLNQRRQLTGAKSQYPKRCSVSSCVECGAWRPSLTCYQTSKAVFTAAFGVTVSILGAQLQGSGTPEWLLHSVLSPKMNI